MKKIVFALCALMLFAAGADAKKKKKVETPPAKPRQEVRPAAREGLFNVQKWKDNWYFQIPDSLLGRLLLVNTRFVSTPVNSGLYGGELANSEVLY